MTDIERIIQYKQKRLDDLANPEIWHRYTKDMECGELREFKQSCIDDEIIIAALRAKQQRGELLRRPGGVYMDKDGIYIPPVKTNALLTPCSLCGYGGKHLDAPPCTTCPAHPKGQQPNAAGEGERKEGAERC